MRKLKKIAGITALLFLTGFMAVAGPQRTAAADVSATEPAESLPVKEEPKMPQKVSEIHLCAQGKTKVKLQWQGSEGATHYKVHRRKKGSSAYRYITTVKTGVFTDRGLSYGTSYQYRITPLAKSSAGTAEGKATTVTFKNVKAVSTNHQKYTYEEMKADIELLAKNYYGLVQYEVIGKSTDGRNLYDVILGNPKAKKTLLVVSTLHAREYMASLVCMNQIEYYLQNYQKKIGGKTVKETLDKVAVHYIPMANPDGVTLSQFGIQKIQSASLQKQLRKIGNGDTTRWKANARGVDLNNNFPFNFKKCSQRRSAGCAGPSAASERETKAIVNLVKQLKRSRNLKGIVNYHAMGSIIYGDYRTGASCARDTARMYNTAKRLTGYRKAYDEPYSSKGPGGSFRSYVMYKLYIPSITIEVGKKSCPGPISEFPSIWSKNKDVVLQEARLFA